MGREVAIKRGIGILFQTTTNRHDLPRTVLLAPLLDQINCVREPADKFVCKQCGTAGAVNITPNWHDMKNVRLPFSKSWNK